MADHSKICLQCLAAIVSTIYCDDVFCEDIYLTGNSFNIYGETNTKLQHDACYMNVNLN